ncbi:MAG TPA: hypothetical protein VEA78_05145 [Acidimicrobiales bacterium]|nr:hypothetical protein [Acidimicrobiales bacterium]
MTGRRAWLAIGSLATILTLGFSTFLVVNVVAHDEVMAAHRFAADDVDVLDLRSENGHVEIIGADVDEIEIIAAVDHGLRRTSHDVDLDGRTVVVRDDCPTGIPVWCRVDYDLLVPRDLPLVVRTDNGSIDVRDVDADVRVQSRNGSIDLVRLRGRVDASTVNGSLRARGLTGDDLVGRADNGSIRVSFSESPSYVDVRGRHGSIDVVVPDEEGVRYRVDGGSAFRGSIDVGVRTDRDSERIIVAETQIGSVTIRYPAG